MSDDAIERARQSLADTLEKHGRPNLARKLRAGAFPAVAISTNVALEAMLAFASQQAPTAYPLPEKRGLEELALLYNHVDDDSRQFTRWQMLAAINHGIRLSAMLDAAPSVTLGEVG